MRVILHRSVILVVLISTLEAFIMVECGGVRISSVIYICRLPLIGQFVEHEGKLNFRSSEELHRRSELCLCLSCASGSEDDHRVGAALETSYKSDEIRSIREV